MVESRRFAGLTRDMLARGHRVVAQNPGDPRAVEMLGAAYNFCASHPEAGDGREAGEYEVLAISTLTNAADLAWNEPRFFRSDAARADFLRRLSYSLQNVDALPEAAAQARRAFELAPDSADNCTRLAHTCRAISDWEGARQAYTALEACMPEDPVQRTLRFTEFGDLLLYVLDDPRAAMPRYRRAIEGQTGPDRAYVGLARCEVLVGQGAEGYRLATEVNQRSPERVDALLVTALFELRSHEIARAHHTYRQILSRWPTNYEALRGFQEVCANTGTWDDAPFAWFGALEREPDNQAFASYLAWSVACAGRSEAVDVANRVLDARPDDPFACYAHMLLSLREGQIEQALQWVARAANGTPVPQARESLRADKTLELMLGRDEIDSTALIARAAIWKHLGNLEEARRLATEFIQAHPDSPAVRYARELAAE
jgi:tetratricopeptide (TPR) repeat protein